MMGVILEIDRQNSNSAGARQAIGVNEAKHVNANANTFETVALDLSAFADSEMALAA